MLKLKELKIYEKVFPTSNLAEYSSDELQDIRKEMIAVGSAETIKDACGIIGYWDNWKNEEDLEDLVNAVRQIRYLFNNPEFLDNGLEIPDFTDRKLSYEDVKQLEKAYRKIKNSHDVVDRDNLNIIADILKKLNIPNFEP